jgi:glycosyltransferase involved in cell wall biosynthesis
MSRLIADRRPDIVMIGRESFAWHVPDVVDAHRLPSVQRVAGGTTHGIARGNYPPALADEYVRRLRRATRRVAPSRHLADILAGLGIGDVVAILNAVDLKLFAPDPKDPALQRRLGLADDDVVVMQAGTMKDMKRPLDIVHSAQKALQRSPKLAYLIVGDGDLRGAVEAACRDRGVAHRFRFAGHIDYPDLPAYFQLADIVLMTSEYEGLSRVYIEALACGRTLVASDIPSVHEVLTPGENGLVFRTGDIDELTERTLQAAADPKLRLTMGRLGRARVECFHDLDRAVDDYLELLAEAVHAFLA